MIHTVIYIDRSGSTYAAKRIANEKNAVYMSEVMYHHRSSNIQSYIDHYKNILLLGNKKNILVKFHINDLLKIYNYSPELFNELFDISCNLYYPIRLDYKSQLISQMIAFQTQTWSRERNISEKINLQESDIPFYRKTLIRHLSIQGEWYKQYPGELIILENNKQDPYPKYNYEFKGVKTFLRKEKTNDYSYLFPKLDVLEIFNKGNPNFSSNYL